MATFKCRSPMAQVNYLRHVRKQVEACNPFATKLMISALITAAEEWYLDPRTPSKLAQLLHAEMDLLAA